CRAAKLRRTGAAALDRPGREPSPTQYFTRPEERHRLLGAPPPAGSVASRPPPCPAYPRGSAASCAKRTHPGAPPLVREAALTQGLRPSCAKRHSPRGSAPRARSGTHPGAPPLVREAHSPLSRRLLGGSAPCRLGPTRPAYPSAPSAR